MKFDRDYTLYLVTDSRMTGGRSMENIVAEAVKGGATMVQLREKMADSREFYEKAIYLKQVTDAYGVPLIINDRVDIMLAVDAAGVHVGQSDLPAGSVRRIIGMDKILGVSAATMEEARCAEQDGADYLGVGAVFPTSTKLDAHRTGIDMVRAIADAVHIPVVAIGGIQQKNVKELSGTGIAGIAVVSAIMAAADPRQAAESLKNSVYGML